MSTEYSVVTNSLVTSINPTNFVRDRSRSLVLNFLPAPNLFSTEFEISLTKVPSRMHNFEGIIFDGSSIKNNLKPKIKSVLSRCFYFIFHLSILSHLLSLSRRACPPPPLSDVLAEDFWSEFFEEFFEW